MMKKVLLVLLLCVVIDSGRQLYNAFSLAAKDLTAGYTSMDSYHMRSTDSTSGTSLTTVLIIVFL